MRALLLALALVGCAQPSAGPDPVLPTPTPTPAPQARTEFGRLVQADMARLEAELAAPGIVSAGAGQTADLGGGLSVRPIAIVEDSRCPRNATCLWGGRLRLRVAISGRDAELTLGEPLQTPNGAVELAVVSPGAWAEWPSDELGPRPPYRYGFRRA